MLSYSCLNMFMALMTGGSVTRACRPAGALVPADFCTPTGVPAGTPQPASAAAAQPDGLPRWTLPARRRNWRRRPSTASWPRSPPFMNTPSSPGCWKAATRSSHGPIQRWPVSRTGIGRSWGRPAGSGPCGAACGSRPSNGCHGGSMTPRYRHSSASSAAGGIGHWCYFGRPCRTYRRTRARLTEKSPGRPSRNSRKSLKLVAIHTERVYGKSIAGSVGAGDAGIGFAQAVVCAE